MTLSEMVDLFAEAEDRLVKWKPEGAQTARPDLHAMLLLESLVPGVDKSGRGLGPGDFVCAAEHDQIWLDVDCEKLAAVVTEAQVRELSACGVFYDDGTDSLSMFV